MPIFRVFLLETTVVTHRAPVSAAFEKGTLGLTCSGKESYRGVARG